MLCWISRVRTKLGFHLARIPDPAVRHLTARRPIVVEGQRLEPRTQYILSLLSKAAPAPLESLPLARARREYREMCQVLDAPNRSLPQVEDDRIPGPESMLRVRIYRSTLDRTPRRGLVYFHGGGGVIGDLESHDPLCRLLCRELDGPVIAVDYRLAPEHPFPAACEDALVAYRWVRNQAASLGVDPARVAVGGDSMGGNLAAVVCQQERDAGKPVPVAQLLLYPMTDVSRQTASMRSFARGFLLTRSMMDWFIGQYLAGADRSDPRVSPLRHADLSGLAPAVVLTAGFDPLRDEGRAYADALKRAGSAVRYRDCEGLVHGFAQMTGALPPARQAILDAVADLRALMAGS